MQPTITHTTFSLPEPFGGLMVAATEAGLCWAMLGAASARTALETWVARRLPAAQVVAGSHPHLTRAGEALARYWAGQPDALAVPLDLYGTPFQQTVWRAVVAIPSGSTLSYTALATRIGRAGAARAVGAANGANPLPLFVPCHRLVGQDGALRGYRGGLPLKRALLDLEQAGGRRPEALSARSSSPG